MTWSSHKQLVPSSSSAEAEYRAMVETSACMLWVRNLLLELGYPVQGAMPMYSDNQAAIFIANNPTFHLRTMHIEISCHVIRHRILEGLICTSYVASSD